MSSAGQYSSFCGHELGYRITCQEDCLQMTVKAGRLEQYTVPSSLVVARPSCLVNLSSQVWPFALAICHFAPFFLMKTVMVQSGLERKQTQVGTGRQDTTQGLSQKKSHSSISVISKFRFLFVYPMLNRIHFICYRIKKAKFQLIMDIMFCLLN